MAESNGIPPRLVTGPTLSDQAYLALRGDIIAGRYSPGVKLTERALAEDLGVSPTPVREALRRLEHERLIERDSVRTIRVADPSTSHLYDLTLIEAALRGVAARLAAERATDAERTRLVRTCEQAEELQASPDLRARVGDLLKITRRFHELVDHASHNPHLVDMIATATAFDFAFRSKWSARFHRTAASLRVSLEQHRAVALAVQSGDAESAEHVMREHILERAAAMIEVATAEPGVAPPTAP
jgi:DNA-binding GntR family transcriptional regulator